MKQELSPRTIAIVLVLVAVVVVVAAILFFKPSFGNGPPVKPHPFRGFGGHSGPSGATAPSKPAQTGG